MNKPSSIKIHDNSRKLLERAGFKYAHDILRGPSEIEVCM
jgi:hypothetical protein